MDDFLCPRCGTREAPANKLAAQRLRQVGRCQGCRAGETLRHRPWLLPIFVDFWKGAGFPSSDSWLQGLAAASDTEGRVPADPSRTHLEMGERS